MTLNPFHCIFDYIRAVACYFLLLENDNQCYNHLVSLEERKEMYE